MNDDNLKLLKGYIGESYVSIAEQSRNSFNKKVRILFEQKKIPEKGFNDNEIEILLREFANMDANNSHSFCGVGEREGRIYSNLVRSRHFGFSHGVGRSGDISALQPKAVGSSAMNALVNHLLLHLVHIIGMKSACAAVLIPMATGMTIALAMSALRPSRPSARYVIWSRIDQKSCFKSILAAGFEPIIIEPLLVGDELQTNVIQMQQVIEERGADHILCILTTTSCFAPRVPDDIMKVSKLCLTTSVPHIVNNAYGLTLRRCMNVIEEAGRQFGASGVHVVIQSADKNLLVPVGGAIAISPSQEVISRLSRTYAGRGASSPAVDVLISLLSMGVSGFLGLVAAREANFGLLRSALATMAATDPRLRLMHTPHNPVSLALAVPGGTTLGARLFHRGVSGARVVESARTNPSEKSIEGFTFVGFGSHSCSSTVDYINVAAAIGQSPQEIDEFIERFKSVLSKISERGSGSEAQ